MKYLYLPLFWLLSTLALAQPAFAQVVVSGTSILRSGTSIVYSTPPPLAISLGQLAHCTINGLSEVQTCTSPSVTTTASGSSFYITVLSRSASAGMVQGSATIATTVMTVTGTCTGTPGAFAVGMQVNGAGITQGTTISSLGTGSGCAGTYNMSLSNTVGTSETVNGFSSPAITATDSKSNTYTQIGSNLFTPQNPPITIARFLCTNCTGGASHTFTVSLPATFIASWNAWMYEIQNGNLSTLIDQSNTNSSNFASQAWTAGNITITPPSSQELMISTLSESEFPGTTISVAGPWTLQSSQSNNSGSNPPGGGLATFITGSSGTYTASFTTTNGGAGAMGAAIDSFKGH